MHFGEGEILQVHFIFQGLRLEERSQHRFQQLVIFMLLDEPLLFARADFRFPPENRYNFRVEPHFHFHSVKLVAGLLEYPLRFLDFLQALHHLFLAVRLEILDGILHVGADVPDGFRALLNHGANLFRLALVMLDLLFQVLDKLGHGTASLVDGLCFAWVRYSTKRRQLGKPFSAAFSLAQFVPRGTLVFQRQKPASAGVWNPFMKDHEVKALFKTTLEDFQLSRNERGEIRGLLDVIKDNEQKRALFRSMAFDEAREALGKADAGQRFQVIDWLENTVKALHPAENLPGTAKGTAASAWFSPDDNCVGKINDLFAQARASVDICVFTITDNRIAEAIEKAHRRRVQIRVISDDDKAMDAGSDIERLDRSGISVRVDKSEHHMHHKFAIFDKRQLLSGSYNWTRSAALNNVENFMVTSDPELLKAYTRMFDKLWRNFS